MGFRRTETLSWVRWFNGLFHLVKKPTWFFQAIGNGLFKTIWQLTRKIWKESSSSQLILPMNCERSIRLENQKNRGFWTLKGRLLSLNNRIWSLWHFFSVLVLQNPEKLWTNTRKSFTTSVAPNRKQWRNKNARRRKAWCFCRVTKFITS